jgi:hypothetical protein
MGGNYGQIVDELYKKYNVPGPESFNPCRVAKLILADDESLSNLALRSMIEREGKFQIFSFYNGTDVSWPADESRRTRSTKREERRSAWCSWTSRCQNAMDWR